MLAFLGAHKIALWLAGAAALAVFIGWLMWERVSLQGDLADANREIGRIEGQRDAAVKQAKENAQAVITVQDKAKRDLAAVVAERNVVEIRTERVRTAVKEIENAPTSDDGPIAPVLRDAARFVDSLRETANRDPDTSD